MAELITQSPATNASPYSQSSSLSSAAPGGPVVDRDGKPVRQASIDAYRGIVMFLMLAEVLELMSLAEAYPNSSVAQWLRFHTTHVEWIGVSLHDMIQPSFSFLVGVSLPFSIAARTARGTAFVSLAAHAAWRSIILIALGIVLRSLKGESTNFTFDDTLTQIGLGYFVLFWLANYTRWVQVAAITAILFGYWALFAFWPLPPTDFEWAKVGVPADWPHLLSGFQSHWNKNANPASYFDQWFMNLFPRKSPFVFAGGGYSTLSFIPTLATMLLGVIAGQMLRDQRSSAGKLARLLAVGAILTLAGFSLGYFGLCPVVKRIWTPSWVLVSAGLCFLWLGALFAICDVGGWRSWSLPFLVIGANSIIAYTMSWVLERPLKDLLHRHLGDDVFRWAGEAWEPILLGSAVLICMWLILLWLFRQRIFVRI